MSTALSKPLQLAGGVMGSIDVMGQMAKKVLTGSDAEIDLNTKAQLWDNVARNIQDTSRDVLAQGALGEKRSWLYDAGVMAVDDMLGKKLDKKLNLPIIEGLEINSSALGYFKDAKDRGDSDEEALKTALTGVVLDMLSNASKQIIKPYIEDAAELMGMRRVPSGLNKA